MVSTSTRHRKFRHSRTRSFTLYVGAHVSVERCTNVTRNLRRPVRAVGGFFFFGNLMGTDTADSVSTVATLRCIVMSAKCDLDLIVVDVRVYPTKSGLTSVLSPSRDVDTNDTSPLPFPFPRNLVFAAPGRLYVFACVCVDSGESPSSAGQEAYRFVTGLQQGPERSTLSDPPPAPRPPPPHPVGSNRS